MKINVKSLVAYVFIMIVSLLFMLFLDGPGGTYLIIVTSAALLISFGIFMWTKVKLSYSVRLSEDVLDKGDLLCVELILRKQGILPTSIIKFTFSESPFLFSDSDEVHSVVIFGHSEEIIEKNFKAIFFGNGRAGVEKIIISDYFGIFSYEIIDKELMQSIRIYPDIPDVSGKDSFARSLTDAVAFDDSEETTKSADSICGTPGYEHRQYIPGDNLKLINWKLSAKRGDLLVRKLEGTGNGEQIFALSFDNFYFAESQMAAEAMLGLIMNFAKAELPLRVILFIDGRWQEKAINNIGDLQQLRYDMTGYNIFPLSGSLTASEREALHKRKIPDVSENEHMVVFAPVFDEEMAAMLNRVSSEGADCQLAVCTGEANDNRVRKIIFESGNVRFSD